MDKTAGGTGSDYSLAKMLGTEPNRISNYRRGVSQMDDVMCLKVAELLGVQAMRIIGDIESERARDSRSKKFWLDEVKRNGGKVAAVILTASGAALSSGTALLDCILC